MATEGRRGRDVLTDSESTEVKPSETTETLAEVPRRRTGGQKRKAASALTPAAGSSSMPSKRLIKERNALNIQSVAHNGPCTRARQFPSRLASGSPQTPQEGAATTEAVVVESGKEILESEVPVNFGEEAVSPPNAPTVGEEFEAVRSRGVSVHVVPTPAGWFSWKKIHELEKHSLPSFFNGQSESRTPDIYLQIRNSIVKKFHYDPQTLLEVKDLPEISAGQLDDRKEVLEFLDHWGLINFHPFPHCNDDASVPEAGSEKPSSLLNQLYQFEIGEPLISYVPKKHEFSSSPLLPQLVPETSLLDDMTRPADPSVEYHCNSCSADCSRRRYHCQKQADFDLCSDCYNNGNFGSGMTPADFILMESAEGPGVSGRSWTDQETLLLLEALELFGENWNEIAEHVATKTKAQCILHFLQMPIEDPFLEDQENFNINIPEKVESCSANLDSSAENIPEAIDHDNDASSDKPVSSMEDVSGKKEAEVDQPSEIYSNFAVDALKSAFLAVNFTSEEGSAASFAEAGNPVMTLAAFLAGLVDRDVVTTSSRSSLKAMSEDSPGIQLASRHCFILEEPPNDAKSPVPESADVSPRNDAVVKEEGQLPTQKCFAAFKSAAFEQSEVKQSSLSNEAEVPIESSTEKPLSESDDKTLPEGQAPESDRKEASKFDEPMARKIDNLKELEESGQGGDMPCMDKSVDDLKVCEQAPKFSEQSINPDLDQVQENIDLPKVACTIPTSIDLKEEEPQQKEDAASPSGVNEMAGGDENKKPFSVKNNRNVSSIAENPHVINCFNRAAVSLLSAAAVKAKLLADQEEDQIRQLAARVIEKQLHKMEIKLAFFPELENLIIKAKEQTERARQKLINERSQIIAARLGLPQPSRSYPTLVTNSKLSTGHANTSLRPPSMAYQKPPPPRRP